MRTIDIDTPVGLGRVLIRDAPAEPEGWLLLGHGAGGGVETVDLLAVARGAAASGWSVALVVQPWKVAGRKVAVPPPQLDRAWTAIVGALREQDLVGGRTVFGGRSAGARVACRTARDLGAAAVCCLAFPLHPPGKPDRSRVDELATCGVPALVVQGRRDPFGSGEEILTALQARADDPGPGRGVSVVPVDGDHGLKAAPADVAAAVTSWLQDLPA